MVTEVYKLDNIVLVGGEEIEISPLKIKYLKEFMDVFESVKSAKNDDEAIAALVDCTRVTMKQFCPRIKTIEDVEDEIDLPSIYKILDVAAGIKIKPDEEETVKKQATDSGATWDTLDLVKLESELFLLGIWKDYDELERSLSMPELTVTLEAKRDSDYQDKKFMAAIQGVDLDKNSGKQDAWEQKKAKFFSGGRVADGNDVVALQGANASKAGFGIGMGLDYVDMTKK